MYIVGIDIAKRKHEAAVIDGDGAVIIKPFSFTNNCSGYNRLLAMLTKAKLPLDEVSFAMEATGHYWLALFTRLQKENGLMMTVPSPSITAASCFLLAMSIPTMYIVQAPLMFKLRTFLVLLKVTTCCEIRRKRFIAPTSGS